MSAITQSKTAHPLRADLLLVLVTMLAGTGWVFSREAVSGFQPLTFMSLRFCTAGVILAALGWTSLRALNAAQLRAALRVGLLFGIAMLFWITGLRLTTHLGVGSFLCSLGLVMVPLVSLVFGDRPGPSAFLALPVALAGLACLSLDSEFHLGVAEACFLGSAAMFALMYVLSSHAAARTPALPLTAIQLLVTGCVTGLAAAVLEPLALEQPPAIWGWLLASILIATCMRFLFQTHAMGQSPPSHSAIIMNLEPVWTALLAALWFGERMTLLQLCGCGLIFSALLVNRWPMLRKWLRSLA
ncbi:DMT family transporter [Spongiibacter nanhainus]|uniref:DMT family transporter n=1 Tax=Spongiibacter nanhainus TaxID=2794344 RepID=A0A7T4R1N2_9GAMM|nr:DMT family transporter [Spongiibacter nanhainus]QQD18619.1 DMT family transporter [Spongiibacter nanhainus]